MGRNSRKLPGQPCSKITGIASSRSESRAAKWISKSPVSILTWDLKFGKEFMLSSHFLLSQSQLLLHFGVSFWCLPTPCNDLKTLPPVL